MDIVAVLGNDPGHIRWVKSTAKQLGLLLDLPSNEVFDTLYPIEALEDNWKARSEKWEKDADVLAERWSQDNPGKVIEDLGKCEASAKRAAISWPDLRVRTCFSIANRVQNPDQWAREARRLEASADVLLPFLRRMRELEIPEWAAIAKGCLDSRQYRAVAVDLVLTATRAPASLIEKAIQHAGVSPGMIEMGCMRQSYSIKCVRALLNQGNRAVSAAAAIGEWMAGHPVREELRIDWEQAVIGDLTEGHFLEEILASDSGLARRWLEKRLRSRGERLWKSGRAISVAATVIAKEERGALIPLIPADDMYSGDVAKHLIASDLDLFSILLGRTDLRAIHLSPLAGSVAPQWIGKAIMALDHGYEPAAIAAAAYGSEGGFINRESSMWEGRSKGFARLLDHPDARIRQVGDIGKRGADLHLARALEREEHEAVHGYDW
jgi:hypothetical protein